MEEAEVAEAEVAEAEAAEAEREAAEAETAEAESTVDAGQDRFLTRTYLSINFAAGDVHSFRCKSLPTALHSKDSAERAVADFLSPDDVG